SFHARPAKARKPGPTICRTPARALRDAIEPIATICFWAEPAFDRYADLGLDFLEGYVWGRACVLGEPAGTVVASAFGVFEPSVVEGLYDAGRSKCSPSAMRAAKEAGAVGALRPGPGGPGRPAGAVAVLQRGVAAADSSGRPMHAGLMSMERTGPTLPGIAPSNVYPTSDGQLLIAANQDSVFQRLTKVMGRSELADDPRFANHQAR